ncbi:molybdate ABC transporter substrate-binding protein [Maribius pontilimi]|uniref:Molybdate ABC transporter substrate-binding protein n=1 Tax=Palleronia pontilimi TaxID=1964209 RepID=A0A934IGD1_9RHOB|nr:molybdate ABC transporter substrate-binding protein [Palleronia pontilimi]MBJ3762925.1 molybdate ABC transporter substrate-binding protein [Palleronia pontilimi]
MLRALALILSFLLPVCGQAGEVRLAVASNMLPAARDLADAFAAATGHSASIAHGATGRLFTQITQGAPFDVFLAADRARPDALEQRGLSHARRTYALGRLVLVGRDAIRADGLAATLVGRRVAIADPALAPYGVAAMEVLEGAGVDPAAMTVLWAESVAQVAVWVQTGNAEYGFLAASLVPGLEARGPLVIEPVPSSAHAPIAQDAVWLAGAADSAAARAFWDWFGGAEAARILSNHGYDVPAP